MAQVAPKYKLHEMAFLPTAGVDPKTGQPIFEAHEEGAEIAYTGEPNIRWIPLNDAARKAQADLIAGLLTLVEQDRRYVRPDALRTLDEMDRRMRGLQQQREALLKGLVEDLVDAPTAAPSPIPATSAPASQQPLKTGQSNGGRPSDRPDRR